MPATLERGPRQSSDHLDLGRMHRQLTGRIQRLNPVQEVRIGGFRTVTIEADRSDSLYSVFFKGQSSKRNLKIAGLMIHGSGQDI
jgi:hypothetical protein